MQNENKQEITFDTRMKTARFPALGTGLMYVLLILIGSLDCLRLL